MSNEFDQLNWNLKGAKQPVKRKCGLDHNLEFSEHSPFLIFRTDKIIDCEIGICNPKCETVEQISKRWCGNKFVLAERNWFHSRKKTTKHPDKKAGITWLCRLSITAGVWVAKPSSYNIGWNTIWGIWSLNFCSVFRQGHDKRTRNTKRKNNWVSHKDV